MTKYYYLNGPEKKGPISEEELISLNLSLQTLIWSEGFANWTPLSEIPELLKIIPPPPPEEVIVNSNNAIKSKKGNYFTILFLVLFLITIFTIFVLTNKEKKASKLELENRIENIFNGKLIVCDAIHSMVTGELTKVSPNKRITISLKTGDTIKDNPNKYKIAERFHCNSGGFTFKKLKKVDNGYEIESIISTDMAYKVNVYAFKPPIETAYNQAYKYFKDENSGSFENGSYDLITNFEFLKNELFRVENVTKPSYPNSSHWWSTSDGGFDYDYQILYYKNEGYYYEVRPIKNEIRNFTIQLSIKALLVMAIIFFLLYFTNPFKW